MTRTLPDVGSGIGVCTSTLTGHWRPAGRRRAGRSPPSRLHVSSFTRLLEINQQLSPDSSSSTPDSIHLRSFSSSTPCGETVDMCPPLLFSESPLRQPEQPMKAPLRPRRGTNAGVPPLGQSSWSLKEHPPSFIF